MHAHAARCNTCFCRALLQGGLPPKGLQEAIVLHFCSFFVQMKCAPQLESALPVVFLGGDVNLAKARCRLQQLILVFPTKGTRVHGHQMSLRHVCNLHCSIPSYQGPLRPKVGTGQRAFQCATHVEGFRHASWGRSLVSFIHGLMAFPICGSGADQFEQPFPHRDPLGLCCKICCFFAAYNAIAASQLGVIRRTYVSDMGYSM